MWSFYKLMIDKENEGSSVLDEFESIAQVRLFSRLILRAQDQTRLIWYKNPLSVEELCSDLGIGKDYLNKLLKRFKDMGVLHSPVRGTYIISKRYLQAGEGLKD